MPPEEMPPEEMTATEMLREEVEEVRKIHAPDLPARALPLDPPKAGPDYVLESPNSVPQELKDFAARDYERVNRHEPPKASGTKRNRSCGHCSDTSDYPVPWPCETLQGWELALELVERLHVVMNEAMKAAGISPEEAFVCGALTGEMYVIVERALGPARKDQG